MVNIVGKTLSIMLVYGGAITINKRRQSRNFIYLLFLLTLWLLSYIRVEHKRIKMTRSLVHLYVLLSGAVLLAIKTKSLLLFFIYFETSIIPISLIIFLYGYQPEKLQATLFLLLYTIIGGLPLLLFILHEVYTYTSKVALSIPMTLGFMIKTPIYLFHTWLPKAHVEAPVGGSMVLAGVLLKLGTYGLLLFLPYIKTNSLLVFYIRMSLIGSVVGSLICLRQGDIKVLIAYSSVVHIGVVRLGLLRGTELGYTCAIIMVLSHGVCSPFLFAFSYWLYGSSHSRMLINNMTSWPIMAGLMISLVGLNIGLPPRLGLWSEVLITLSTLYIIDWAFPILIVIFFFGLLYNLYVYTSCIHSKFTNTPLTLSTINIMPCIQVCSIGFLSFLCLDIFHL